MPNAPTTVSLPLPSALATPVTTLQTDLQAGLSDGNRVIANIPATDALLIAADVAALNTAAEPLITGTDATVASPAVDATIWAGAIGTLVGQPSYTKRVLRLVNPNLFLLAAQYLGDPRRWQDIAAASNLPPDPQPIGMYQIVIPSG
jgi:hypothetical protein